MKINGISTKSNNAPLKLQKCIENDLFNRRRDCGKFSYKHVLYKHINSIITGKNIKKISRKLLAFSFHARNNRCYIFKYMAVTTLLFALK